MAARHHRGKTYEAGGALVIAAAKANPLAVCWRDGRTLDQHPAARDGTRPTWTRGHTIDGDLNPRLWLRVTERPPPGSWLAPEASCCNYAAGAKRTNRWRGNPQSEQWFKG